MAHKYVYLFSEGNGSMRELLGGKGANLAEMTSLGLPVPQGFIVSTEACNRYYEDGEQIAPEIEAEIGEYLKKIEEINDKELGNPAKPLLVSVRSGARASMPGMMDTILNLGINDEVAAGLIAGNDDPKFERFVYDSYRRFVQMYSDVVMGLSKKRFEVIIDELKERKGVQQDIELDTEDLKEMLARFREFYKEQLGEEFPQDPQVQLYGAIKAVFRSWNNERAIYYRKMNEIPSSWGTAVSVMPMVFGNLNNNSGTGVAFTRNPATGEKGLFGEFLMNAQGEDVVAGVRTPSSIAELQETNPAVYEQFSNIATSQLMALLLSAMVLLVPIVMLSGMLFPVESMPCVLQWISAIVPPRYYIEAMRKLMIMGVGIKEVMRETLVLITFTVVLLGISLVKFNKRLE